MWRCLLIRIYKTKAIGLGTAMLLAVRDTDLLHNLSVLAKFAQHFCVVTLLSNCKIDFECLLFQILTF